MPGAFQVAGVVFEAGELGAEIHGDAAALPVIGAHGQVPRARVDVRADGEFPAPAHARDIEK